MCPVALEVVEDYKTSLAVPGSPKRRTAMTELLDIPQCSALLGLSERWVYEMLRRKRLPGAAKVGGKWRIDKAKLIAWIAKGGELADGDKSANKK